MRLMIEKYLILCGLMLLLLAVNWQIYKRADLKNNGKEVWVKLAPVDPRSLMQGDYMALRYDDTLLPAEVRGAAPQDGRLVVSFKEGKIAEFSRIDNGEKLKDGEFYLKYRLRWQRGFEQSATPARLVIGADSFFFEEGREKQFARAIYGVFKVSENGDALLIGMADAKGRILANTGTN